MNGHRNEELCKYTHTHTRTHTRTCAHTHTHCVLLYMQTNELLNTVVIIIHMNAHTLVEWMCRVGGVYV